MMKLLTAAVIVALATPSTAQVTRSSPLELTCTVRQLLTNEELRENRYESDPVKFIRITIDDVNNPSSMSVVHVMRHGDEVNRSDQYSMGVKLNEARSAVIWFGTDHNNSNVQMSGILERKDGQWAYVETRFDHGQRSWANFPVCS